MVCTFFYFVNRLNRNIKLSVLKVFIFTIKELQFEKYLMYIKDIKKDLQGLQQTLYFARAGWKSKYCNNQN